MIKDLNLKIVVYRKPIKNLYLRLDNNNLIVSAPLNMEEYKIYNFINSKKDWIYKTYQKINQKTSLIYKGGNVFYLFNEEHVLNFNVGKNNCFVRDNVIYLSYKNESDDAINYLYKYFDKLVLNKAQEILQDYRYILLDYGYHQEPILSIRKMKTKWGVCYSNKNKICLSSYLIHYDLDCLKYIVLHELVHFIMPNHSKRFYQIIENNMPNYKEIVKRLK